ncbi:Actin-binding protein IPP [Pseudocercospora fuligena]|uniref:Actin-binding protein IPP n=1 Tax=Pseudocercospora fuligena TaxID=685502 RepID=A0A8H6VJH3_9PEZI|nr:Actin-binding protein IPP [Pseudocercospora fuligena]
MGSLLSAWSPSLGGAGADTQIQCGNRTFNVHRAVVCARSPVMAAEYECGSQDSGKQIVHHAFFDADTIERMLQFMYEQSYTAPDMPAEALLVHVRVQAAGDLYELPELKNLAHSRFQDVAGMILVNQLDTQVFLIVAQETYRYAHAGYDGLKEEVWAMSMNHARQLSEDDDFVVEMLASDTLRELAWAFVRGLPAVANAETDRVREEHATDVSALQAEIERLKSRVNDLEQHNTDCHGRIRDLMMEVSGLKSLKARDTGNLENKARELEEARINVGRLQKVLRAMEPDASQLVQYERIVRCRGCLAQPFFYRFYRRGRTWGVRCVRCRARHWEFHCRR